MPLMCECASIDDAEWYWWPPDDYSVMPARKRRRRCASCLRLIDAGSTIIEFEIRRPARSDIELAIYGEEYNAIPMASRYFCEACADQWWNLTELGFCASPDDDMRALLLEYQELRKEQAADRRGWPE